MANVNTDPTGRIQKTAPNGQSQVPARRTLAAQIDSAEFKKALSQALPKHITPDRMARIAMTALRTTRDLAQCTPESFFSCLMQAAQLGLEPNTPNQHVYLIPRRNKGVLECTLIVGYQGQIELALRSGKVEKIWTRVVREGDEFQVEYGLTENITHRPSTDPQREQMPITFVYAVAQLKTGGSIFEVLSLAQIEARRKMSAAGTSGPWVQHFEAMARKTAVRSLFKWVPKSAEMALAEHLDERADMGRSQMFDGMVHDAVEKMGFKPIVEVETEPEPEHDPQTGEVVAQEEPGATG